MNPTTEKPPLVLPPAMQADFEKWQANKSAIQSEMDRIDRSFDAVKAEMVATMANLPDAAEIPYAKTPEGERWEEFKKVCDAQFWAKIDYTRVANRAAFDLVGGWDGTSPGPCATGETGAGKSRAAWWALRRLYVKEGKPFVWFPVKKLVGDIARYDERGIGEEFFRMNDYYRILFVDDLDKINWDFQSQQQALFSFFDWIYRKKKPCLVTTNKPRAWWADKMGDAFARRLCDEACVEVKFT